MANQEAIKHIFSPTGINFTSDSAFPRGQYLIYRGGNLPNLNEWAHMEFDAQSFFREEGSIAPGDFINKFDIQLGGISKLATRRQEKEGGMQYRIPGKIDDPFTLSLMEEAEESDAFTSWREKFMRNFPTVFVDFDGNTIKLNIGKHCVKKYEDRSAETYGANVEFLHKRGGIKATVEDPHYFEFPRGDKSFFEMSVDSVKVPNLEGRTNDKAFLCVGLELPFKNPSEIIQDLKQVKPGESDFERRARTVVNPYMKLKMPGTSS